MKAYNLRDTAAEDGPRAALAQTLLTEAQASDDEDVVLVKLPKGQGGQLLAALTTELRVYFNRSGWALGPPVAERLGNPIDGDRGRALVSWLRTHMGEDRGYRGWYEATPDGNGGFNLKKVPS